MSINTAHDIHMCSLPITMNQCATEPRSLQNIHSLTTMAKQPTNSILDILTIFSLASCLKYLITNPMPYKNIPLLNDTQSFTSAKPIYNHTNMHSSVKICLKSPGHGAYVHGCPENKY